MAMEKTNLSWSDIDDLVVVLIERLKSNPYVYPPLQTIWPPKSIVAISRGGLIPGVMIAHRLCIREVHTVTCKSYDDENKQSALTTDIQLKAHIAMLAADCLVVDDIVDTGKTLDYLHKQYPHPTTCALVSKIFQSRHTYAEYVDPKIWVQFPWE